VVVFAVLLGAPSVVAAAERAPGEVGWGWFGGLEVWLTRASSVVAGVVGAVSGHAEGAAAQEPTVAPDEAGTENSETDRGPNIDPDG
jgi:hypothetical protein